jgi:hypothetical protein
MRRSPRTTGGNQPGFGRFLTLLAAALLCASFALAQDKPKKGESAPRTLKGVVTMSDDKPAVHAVVQLENTKTKSIVSFYSQQDGSYYFHELSPDVDYKVFAKLDAATSPTRTLSSFDSRKEAVINLKLDSKK